MTTTIPHQPIVVTDHLLVAWIFELFGYRCNRDDAEREVIITPYAGAYGLAGYVISVNGSPPRGTLLIDRSSRQLVGLFQNVIRRRNDWQNREAWREVIDFIAPHVPDFDKADWGAK